MKKKTSVFIILIMILIVLILLGVLIYTLNRNTNSNYMEPQVKSSNSENLSLTDNLTIHGEYSIFTNSENAKTSPNAIITFFKTYTDCGHTVKTVENISSEMVNLNKDAFCSLYSDWNINKFTSTEIELSKEFSGSCKEHYLVKAYNGYINIYNINEDGSLTLNEETEIATKFLSSSDIDNLEKGITLYGRNSLNSFIEDFE